MSLPDRRAQVDPGKDDLSVRRQCELLAVVRSGVYRPKSEAAASDHFEGRCRCDAPSRRVASRAAVLRLAQFELAKEGHAIHRKHAQRLMRTMGIVALVPRPSTSKPAPGHKIYPYLLRNVAITQPNHVWATDITYIPMQHGFLYLVAVIPANALHSLGLGQPRGSGVASVEHDGDALLHRGARRGAGAPRQAEDIQLRSGQPPRA